MIRIAGERIVHLFALAESESRTATGGRADRYVQLARKVGTRYNVRIPPEFSELFCRGCSAYWVEGRTVRTRFTGGRRTQSCLRCGRVRRILLAPRHGPRGTPFLEGAPGSRRDAAALTPVAEDEESDPGEPDDESE